MIIITIYISIILLARLLAKRKEFIFIAGFSLFIIAALRSPMFGPDPIRYINNYNNLDTLSIGNLIVSGLRGSLKDPIFYVFAKILNLGGVSAQAWLAILAGFFIYSISKTIASNSREPLISYIALISLGYYYFSLTGLRQTFAISIVLFGFSYIIAKKFIPFFLVVKQLSIF